MNVLIACNKYTVKKTIKSPQGTEKHINCETFKLNFA